LSRRHPAVRRRPAPSRLMSQKYRVTLALCALVATVASAACGGASAAASSVHPLDLKNLPADVLDLSVHQEVSRVTALKGVKRPYVDRVGLYSLRSDELLQATLQVSHFTKRAKTASPRFRNTVISQIRSTVPRELRIRHDVVF